MYLHIGGTYQILSQMIVGIFDIEKTEALNPDTEMGKFIKKKEEENLIEYVQIDFPRSIIVTLEKVYLSPISVGTLLKRIQSYGRTTE